MSPRRSVDELLETLGNVTLRLVYIAGTVEEAHGVEDVLDERHIEFGVSLERYTKTFSLALGGQYQGVFFYVPEFEHGLARELLEKRGFHDTVD